jgi:hypothetical protein
MEAISQKEYEQLKLDVEKAIEQLVSELYKQREDKVLSRLAELTPKTHETKEAGDIG